MIGSSASYLMNLASYLSLQIQGLAEVVQPELLKFLEVIDGPLNLELVYFSQWSGTRIWSRESTCDF